jgi:CRP-like cAMP-binding protein
MVRPKSSRSKKASNHSARRVDGREVLNKILLDLPNEEWAVICAKLEFLDLPTRTILNEAGLPIKYGYFLNAGLGSILTKAGEGKSVEVGLCGKEGYVGVPLAAGFRSSPARVLMQVAGNGFRVNAKDIGGVLRACPKLGMALQRFGLEMAVQSAQVAACNRLHEVEERLARWLLMSQDRLGGDSVPLTQEFLAHMLGTRRASVTVAAGILQKAGLIEYVRGNVRIRSRAKLEEASCECYGMMTEQIEKWRIELS